MIWRKLADWCLPPSTFPQWLTACDDPDLFTGWVSGPAADHLLARMSNPIGDPFKYKRHPFTYCQGCGQPWRGAGAKWCRYRGIHGDTSTR